VRQAMPPRGVRGSVLSCRARIATTHGQTTWQTGTLRVRRMNESSPLDEMVDGTGQVRPHWRGVFGTIFSLGHETLNERARLLERAFVEEGITAMLPGEQPVNWRCDPIPLILSAEEFASLETGLAQRARLIDA